MNEPSDMVVVRTYTGLPEAELACSALKAAGMTATLGDEHIVGANWLYSNAVGGVKLLVPAACVTEALAVLDTPAEPSSVEFDEGGAERGTDWGADVCIRCGSPDFEVVERGKRLAALSWLTLGVPLYPVRRSRRCRACGAPAAA